MPVKAFRSFNACLLAAGLAVAAGCGPGDAPPPAPRPALPPPVPGGAFTDVAAAAGVAARHILPTPELRNIVDGVGAGAAFADLDGDGWLDLVVLGGPRSPEPLTLPGHPSGIRVYRNTRDGRFEDVSARTGIPPGATGVAIAVGDADGDGLRDLYIADRGPDRLLRNKGGFRFADVTRKAGLGDPRFGIGAAFFDMDRDGDLDLFAANYLTFDPAERSFYAPDGFPGPAVYNPEPATLYRNRGNGTFSDVSRPSGVDAALGRAMSLAAFDADDDGHTDVLVANDVTEKFLWMNDGRGRFRDGAGLARVAYGEQGERTSAMAADVGDIDGDGQPDVVVSDNAYGTLYRRVRPGLFEDTARRSGLAVLLAQHVTWGANLIDFDNDGDLDLFAVQADLHHLNGWEPLLLENDGRGRFTDAGARGGAPFSARRTGRSSIVGDYDNDGDEDILFTVLGDRPVLLRNDMPARDSWITLDLAGRRARDPFGARVTVSVKGRTYRRELRCRSTYLGQSDSRLHFGLGPGVETIDRIRVVWPDGAVRELTGARARQILSIRQ